MRRANLLQLTVALQAVIAAAACSYDRTQLHPLKARRTQIAHLLRRAGFGASKELLDEYDALGLDKAIDRLVEYEQVDDDVEQRVGMFGLDLKKLGDLQRWWLLRMVYTKRPLQEKMVLFWHGLLTSGSAKVGLPNPTPQNPNPPQYMLDQHNFLRAHAVSKFETIVTGVSRDPAMMIWLDSQTNNKGKPNENFARELMELFTLGIGTYSEQDVREVARAFTGWGLENGKFVFRAANHDADIKHVLGKTGNFDGADVVKLLLAQPAAARYLSRRLFEFFAYPDPSESDLEPLVTAYVRSDGDIKAMLKALFSSPAFFSPRAYRALIKCPVDLVIGAIRTLGVATDGFTLPGVTTRMTQALFNPPNVAGWPGGSNWLNSVAWMERMNFCNALVTARDDGHMMAPPFATILDRQNLKTPSAIFDYFADLLLDGQVSRTMRETLVGYLTNSEPATPLFPAVPTGAAVAGRTKGLPPAPTTPSFVDQKVRGMVYLMLASPEYQLA